MIEGSCRWSSPRCSCLRQLPPPRAMRMCRGGAGALAVEVELEARPVPGVRRRAIVSPGVGLLPGEDYRHCENYGVKRANRSVIPLADQAALDGRCGGGFRSAGTARLEGVGPGRGAGRPLRLLRPWLPDLPDVRGEASDPGKGRRPGGRRRLHREGRGARAEDVPRKRPDGVRLGLRPRRVPRARLHRRLPAPRVEHREARVRRGSLGPRRAAHDRRLPHEPVRGGHRHAHADRRAGRRPPSAGAPLQRASSPSPPPSTGSGQRDHRPGEAQPDDRLLRMDGMGRRR